MNKILLLVIFSFFLNVAFAQQNMSERRMMKAANAYFNNEEYEKALPLYLSLDSLINDKQLTYKIGACYLNSKAQRLKAIPYLEAVSEELSEVVPIDVFYDLGILYHYIYRFEEAKEYFKKYISLAKDSDYASEQRMLLAGEMITVCENAKEITTKPYKAEIQILSYPVNTLESQYSPMISADESMMLYMQGDGSDSSLMNPDIYKTEKEPNGRWGTPEKIQVELGRKEKGKQVKLAGLSHDAQTIYLNVGEGLNQDIYQGFLSGNTVKDLKKLNKEINTAFYEGRVSLSSDGTKLFFVSDRPGGLGGTDIYMATRNRKGDWENPVNLGNVINTPKNEHSPFLHPDHRTLFFSSGGHKTIGGKDIFKSVLSNGVWSEPENLGFSNSTKDDLYFVLNANGQTGYFSSSKNNLFNRHNIYKVILKDPIPLTLLKGTIRAGSPAVPISAQISVYDKEKGEKVKFVYDPNPENGKYIMIFPPAKNYDIYIKAKDYLPQMINVHIPYQTYFYELFQEITLKPIKVGDKMVGEEVVVNNTFYDLYRTNLADSILDDDVPQQPEYYDHLLELVENIIENTDTSKISYSNEHLSTEEDKQRTDNLLNLIEEAIETTDAVTLKILDANTRKNDKVKETHFYDKSQAETNLQVSIFGTDTVYSAPTVNATKARGIDKSVLTSNEPKEKNPYRIRKSQLAERNYIYLQTVYFETNSSSVEDKYYKELSDLADLLIDNPNLGAEIHGYADQVGEERYNLSLSRMRAQSVLRYLLDKKVEGTRLIARGYGEVESSMSEGSDSEEGRRVEVHVFEVK